MWAHIAALGLGGGAGSAGTGEHGHPPAQIGPEPDRRDPKGPGIARGVARYRRSAGTSIVPRTYARGRERGPFHPCARTIPACHGQCMGGRAARSALHIYSHLSQSRIHSNYWASGPSPGPFFAPPPVDRCLASHRFSHLQVHTNGMLSLVTYSICIIMLPCQISHACAFAFERSTRMCMCMSAMCMCQQGDKICAH